MSRVSLEPLSDGEKAQSAWGLRTFGEQSGILRQNGPGLSVMRRLEDFPPGIKIDQ